MPLTDLKIKRIVSQSKDLWLTDEKGLRLLVKPNGAKYWRLKYRFAGKQKTLAIGVYPDVGLKMARDEREKARRQLKQGIDPSVVKKEKKYNSFMSDTNTFSILAKQWWKHEKDVWVEKHAKGVWTRLEVNSFKILDSKPIDQIITKDILDVIKEIENRGALDVARRVLQDIRRVFSYAVRRDFIKYNPASDLSGIVKNYTRKHKPSMKNEELGGFMYDLEQYKEHGFYVTYYALKLLIYTFVRSGEIRHAKWSEFDFEKSLWKIPAERMKMRREHIVPLSTQAIDVLVKVQEITGTHELLFPLKSNWRKRMAENTMCVAMKKMGYDGKGNKSYATPHGFRANATSILNEQGFNPDAIERQLSHIESNSVRAAYIHHAKFMEDRVKMMQWWADFLCEEKEKTIL